MKTVSLFFLTGVRYGGFVSYTAHLAEMFRRGGYSAHIYKYSQRTENRGRTFGMGWEYRNVAEIPSGDMTIVTCAYWGTHAKAITALAESGAVFVLHDPTEFAPELIRCLLNSGSRVIVIRQANVAPLQRAGLAPQWIPHPYCRQRPAPQRKWHGVALSRVDFDKHTDMIVAANARLPVERQCRIFGAVNRMYEYQKLPQGWREYYEGTFDLHSPGCVVAAQGIFLVDMSAIKGDGGGSQYTFLEAWDAGCGLLVNRKWLLPGGSLQEGVNCQAVGSVEELVGALQQEQPPMEIIEAGYAMLDQHDPALILSRYESDWVRRRVTWF